MQKTVSVTRISADVGRGGLQGQMPDSDPSPEFPRKYMRDNIFIYDADAHVLFNQAEYADLPDHLTHRRPREVEILDKEGLGGFDRTWVVDGKLHAYPFGAWAQPAQTPAGIREAFPGTSDGIRCSDASSILASPEDRLTELDAIGVDASVIYPSTIYARLTDDPELEAGLYRAHNRFMGKACAVDPSRLKFSGLLPLRSPSESMLALEEMKGLGAVAALVYGTAGPHMLSDHRFAPVLAALEESGLPLTIHLGMSYPPLREEFRSMYQGLVGAMTIPAFLAFTALTAGGIFDRYPKLKVAILEFGSEWLLYMAPHMDKYREIALLNGVPYNIDVPERDVMDYVRSGNFYIAGEADDELLQEELDMIGEDHWLFSTDMPHPEGRESAVDELMNRSDLSIETKTKLLGTNAVNFYGAP